MELIGSKQGGFFNLSLNAKMLDSKLTDQVSAFVSNEIQEIKISSTIQSEVYVKLIF